MPLSPGKAPEYITSSEWQLPIRVGSSFPGMVVSQGTGCGGGRAEHHHRNVGAMDLGPKEGNEYRRGLGKGLRPSESFRPASGESGSGVPGATEPGVGR